ncbi:ArnT family glycosyltransferase [Roseicella aerolata]|uniref:Glycosyltransferase family 39 protein n=1 Tax=Roseicella aerolata TaxID=2883479 RepID=A0A9X1IBG7_9PROT|nr:glycosyltransferase family 39 protein [Roseicella aerolata]MCB4821751.1 glycosyltransferase family 39 protein [Roseicella aerolata]
MLILLLALLPGAMMLWRLGPGAWDTPGLWSEIALNLANGRGYVSCEPDYFPFCAAADQVTAAREPLPVLVFAALAGLFGNLQPAGMILAWMLNLLILIGTFSIARELGGPRPALLAALIWALYLPAVRIFYPNIAGDAFATLSVTGALLFFLRAAATGRSRDWIICGLCLGLSVLSRSSAIILIPVLAVCTLMLRRPGGGPLARSAGARLRPAVLLVCASVTLLLPWMARNYLAFDRVVIGTTLAGYNLYRHNAMLPTGDHLNYVGPEDGHRLMQDLLARRPDLRGTENEAQMDAVYRQEALRIISDNPGRYLGLSAYRFVLLWFNWGVEATYGHKHADLLDVATMVQQGVLLLLGLIGALVGGWRARPLTFSIGAFVLLHLAVMGRLYHLMPVMPLVVALGALGAVWLLQRVRAPRHPVALPVAGGSEQIADGRQGSGA